MKNIGFLLNYESIKEDFPLLKKVNVVYLDNAATSQKPKQVIESIKRFYEESNANIHRGLYDLSTKATELYEQAHEEVAKFIDAYSWEEVIFTRNTTEALNIIALALAQSIIRPGTEIIVTIMEHHSNLLPWFNVAKFCGAKVKIISITNDGLLNVKELEESISEKTRVIAITHVSNVLGVINDLRSIAKLAHSVDALVVVDGAQSVPHIPVSIRNLGIDFLAFSGHKMLAPTGIGVLWGRKDLLEDLPPVLRGGDMIKSVRLNRIYGDIDVVYNDLPWKFEAGTPNIAGGIGLMEAIKYLKRIGMENVERHEKTLTKYALERLIEELNEHINIIGPTDYRKRSGIISFNIKGYNPFSVAVKLSLDNIAVRAGFHCAQPLHQFLGYNEGSVRASFYIYNGPEDIDKLIESLKELVIKP